MEKQHSSGRGKTKVRFIDPPNILREKVGSGGIESLRLKRAEEYIDESPVDFAPIAQEMMKRLDDIVADAKSGKIHGSDAVDKLTQPIMEIKANGGMFKYMLASEIADIVLNFLENIDELNNEVYDIIAAHQNTLTVIVTNKLRGSGGREGKALAQELYGACKRYYRKYDMKPSG